VFRAYYGEAFLTQVWMPNSDTGNDVRKSKAELRLARGGAKPELLAVVAGGR
jgi:hypothetical protein